MFKVGEKSEVRLERTRDGEPKLRLTPEQSDEQWVER